MESDMHIVVHTYLAMQMHIAIFGVGLAFLSFPRAEALGWPGGHSDGEVGKWMGKRTAKGWGEAVAVTHSRQQAAFPVGYLGECSLLWIHRRQSW